MAFSFYRTVTINKALVPSDQSNFPVLISGTYSYLKVAGSGGNVQNASGFDIGFYSDSALTTKLKWEIERWIDTTGEVIYWVKVPTVSSSVNTVIYMAYGDSGIVSDQSDPGNVFDAVMVQHMPDGTTLSLLDSTSYNNDGTNSGASASAVKIGGGANLSSGNFINWGNAAPLNFTGQFTLSMWINMNNFPSGDFGTLFSKDTGSGDEAYAIRLNNNTDLSLFAYVGGFSGRLANWSISGWSTGVDHLIHGVYDGSDWRLYFDATQVASATEATGAAASSGNLVTGTASGARFLDAKIDEVRVYNTGKGPDWITTEYNNQITPASFYTIGSAISNSTTNFIFYF